MRANVALFSLVLILTAIADPVPNPGTPADLLANLSTYFAAIPAACSTDCTPFQNDYQACTLTVDAIGTCACQPAFLNDLTTCTACITTNLGATDAGAVASQTEQTVIASVCASLVAPITATTTSTPLTTFTSILPSSTTVVPLVSIAAAVSSFSSASVYTYTVYTNSAQPGASTTSSNSLISNGFPIQTKSPSVFAAGSQSISPPWITIMSLALCTIFGAALMMR